MREITVNPKDRPARLDPGPAPMLQWIKIADLVVDDTYQRDLARANWTAIRRIASVFKWSRFSPVFVAPIEGGRYAIIDGQHRTHAAAICGLAEVPCQIVPMDPAEQAASFAAVNGLVTKVTLFQIFKAALAAGEDWAVASAACCEKAGCRLMRYHASTDAKKPGEIYAIRMIRSFVEKGLGDLISYALAALRVSESGAEAMTWSNETLKPLLGAIADRPWLLPQQADLAGFFDRFDIYEAIDEADAMAKQRRRQGATDVSRHDLAQARVGEALDKAFPQRMALPKGVAA